MIACEGNRFRIPSVIKASFSTSTLVQKSTAPDFVSMPRSSIDDSAAVPFASRYPTMFDPAEKKDHNNPENPSRRSSPKGKERQKEKERKKHEPKKKREKKESRACRIERTETINARQTRPNERITERKIEGNRIRYRNTQCNNTNTTKDRNSRIRYTKSKRREMQYR
mmetsp:Transcript_27517/g.64552  ORF Transcript_27517/g.64552 Transcript_27517/m.64552 type:complete len:168 (-) Transcript_27517:559-1062(-)